jgi:23S rRNA (cytosine1962-C5)-methyltransferase
VPSLSNSILFPAASPRLRLRVTAAAEAALRAGHPWLFANSICQQNRPGQLGELAVVYDRRDRFQGLGLFDPESPIRVRILYAGKPQPLDETWWRGHLDQAVERRSSLFDARTTGYRCCNGESDGWPGLVLDRYHTTLVLKLYTAAWLPHLARITELINARLPNERIVLRLSRNIQDLAQEIGPALLPGGEREAGTAAARLTDGRVLTGAALDSPVRFQEYGICFEADVLRGQKTGFFLDQRENRRRVEALARGRAVLNGFSFSGGFSLYAARGGASCVTDVDISAHALESARRNMALNRQAAPVRACRHQTVQADVFDWLRGGAPGQFDLAILDPPSLARREVQRTEAVRAYGRLIRSGIERLRRGGILVAASCSAHVSATEFFAVARQTARQSGRVFHEIETTRHPPDHPAAFPEAEYLKCIYLRFG